MDRRIISGKLRIMAMFAVVACCLMACAGAVYASEDSVLPEKVNGRYEIYTADQMKAFANATNGSQTTISGETMPADKGSSCVLMKDIDFGNTQWVRMGLNKNNPFTGTLDGNGHTISNYTVSSSAPTLVGYNSGIIKNLKVDAGTKSISYWSLYDPDSSIVARTNQQDGVISGVSVTGDITLSASPSSMLVGENYGLIRYCSTHGKLTVTSGQATPLLCRNWQTGVVENCYNTAVIISQDSSISYGLVYHIMTSGSVRNCYNAGKVWRNGENTGTEIYNLTESPNYLDNCYGSNEEFTAEDLGEAFADDLEGEDAINGGYPVFQYELTGEYPHVESAEDIVVDRISYIDDTSMNIISGTKFEYYTPKAGDFIVRAVSEDGRIADIPATSVSMGNKGHIALNFQAISDSNTTDGTPLRTVSDQDITVKLIIAGKEAGTIQFSVNRSRYWSDYGEEPDVVSKTDEHYGAEYSGYYKITKPEELAWIAYRSRTQNVASNCFLANDIYLNDTTDADWADSDELMYWDTPLLVDIFDGNGYTIYGMYYDSKITAVVNSGTTTAGLIKTADSVRNLSVEKSTVNGGTAASAAGIVGGHCNEITDCMFDGKVTGGNRTAGILGTTKNEGTTNIVRCVNKGDISGNSEAYTGGISGWQAVGRIESCYNTGKVAGAGILGYAASSSRYVDIVNSYNAGKVSYAISNSARAQFDNVYSMLGKGAATGKVDCLSEEEFTDGTLLGYLESEDFVADEDTINAGYPVLTWQSPLLAAKAEYPEALQYYVDLNDYAYNREKIQAIIDEASAGIAAASTSAEANEIFETAKSKIDEFYTDEETTQNMADELERIKELIRVANAEYAFSACLISIDPAAAEYTGNAIEPAVTAATKDGKALVAGTDYETAYEANVEPGVAVVKVTGKGDYAGTRELTFNIAPAANKITSLKKAKKAFTVKWTKDEKASGYQVSYGLKKNFKGAKTVKVAKKATVSKKVTKLKAKKKYFVRVRSYVTSGEQTVYGAWSPVKSVKTK